MKNYKGIGKLFGLAVGIMILTLSMREGLFTDLDTMGAWIGAVVFLTAIVGFIGGMIYLIVSDYIRGKR
jgi:hypothetical protein